MYSQGSFASLDKHGKNSLAWLNKDLMKCVKTLLSFKEA
tara:strand:+ start:45 stop:161 length:117 start_codon:yes stop_codon:yes gene_type:complete